MDLAPPGDEIIAIRIDDGDCAANIAALHSERPHHSCAAILTAKIDFGFTVAYT